MEAEDSVTQKPESGWQISKKVAAFLAVVFVGSCVAIGLIVHFAGKSNQCQCVAFAQIDGTTSRPAKVTPPTAVQTVSPTAVQPVPPTEVQTDKLSSLKDIRLPGHLIPEHYTIELVPFIIPGNFTIRGRTIIRMRCVSPGGKNVTLHLADIEVKTDATKLIDQTSGNKVEIAEHKFDVEREFYVMQLRDKLLPGNIYQIEMEFTAQLSDKLKGFYRSMYKDQETGKEEYLAITQFEATDARRAFPCFDEPNLKAKFKISLGRTRDMTSLSNMPILEGGEGVPMDGTNEYVWDHYVESVPMSTYLVAFVVSKFEYRVSDPLDNNVLFRVWARKDAIDQAEFARDIGPKMLRYFEKFFGVPYPLPKQDMLAVEDFGAGAMENWGLITYRETAMLYKPGVSSMSNKEFVSIVISHELAHQWFGNLVSPSWWTDLWLNEGFASYVEYLGVNEVLPEFKLMDKFILMDLQYVMGIDALESSHPISIEVKHPDEINEIFDRITYSKGASIIRMMDHFLTSETFKKGLNKYLNALQFKGATQDDLWNHLTIQAHEDGVLPGSVSVKQIMDTWTLQTGFPVVTVHRHYPTQSATISQNRFFVTKKEDKTKWWIPITFVGLGGNFSDTRNKVWMSPDEKSKDINGLPDPSSPVIFNIQETGFYRVNYDERNWKMIIEALQRNHEEIHVTNRAQILDDALNLARSGLLSYEIALEVTKYLLVETEYTPWSAALDNLHYIHVMLRRSPANGEFIRYMQKLVTPLLKRVGFVEKKNDQLTDIQLRRLAVTWACELDIPECVNKAVRNFQYWMELHDYRGMDSVRTNVDLKQAMYCTAISKGSETEWDFLWNQYLQSNVGGEKKTMTYALSCSKELWILNRFLNWTITDGSGIRKADGKIVISYVASNNYGWDISFQFVKENWEELVDRYGSASFSIKGLLKNVLNNKNTRVQLEELKEFQRAHNETLKVARRDVEQAVESGEANLNWMTNNYEVVKEWLSNENKKSNF